MMNKSKIDWCDFSWNPVTGCNHQCPYCYARKQARRFCGDIRLNMMSPQLQKRENGLFALNEPFHNARGKVVPLPAGFAPTLHEYRLSAPAHKKLPANIFVGSMADLFGAWVPDEWIHAVFEACAAAPWHNYMFLTKNPWRYVQLFKCGLLPTEKNMWYGTSAGNAEQMQKASYIGELLGKYNKFLSIEPLHSNVAAMPEWSDMISYGAWVKWVIIGAETGSWKGKIIPERVWAADIAQSCRAAGVAVFMKDNLSDIWGKELLREFPKPFITPAWESRPVNKIFVESVRSEKKCRQCGASLQGKAAWRISARFYICEDCYKGGEAE